MCPGGADTLVPMSSEAQAAVPGTPAIAPPRPPRSRRRKLVFAAAVWLLVAGALEGGIRVREWIVYGTFRRAGQALYRKTEGGGVELKPNTDITGTDMQVHVNALQFRGHEVVVPKPAGTVRVVCVGGSTTFDILARTDEATWPAQLERRLRAKHPRVEVVNAGVAGYTIDSYLEPGMWKRIAALEPDVVLGYFATNEVAEEARRRFDVKWLHCPSSDFEQRRGDPPSPEACPRCGQKLEVRDEATPPLLERTVKAITDWSLFAYKVQLFVMLFRKAPAVSGDHELPASAAATFEQKLRELVRRTKALGARPALGTFALRWRADQPAEKQRELAAGAFPIYVGLSLEGIDHAFEAYNAAIARVARGEGGVLVPVASALSGESELFGDFVHFSEAGSTRMAVTVEQSLESSGVLDR